ncbi:MAG: oligosaccharide flippase family protein, partial [Muribaculaceae bacterium]|nr:oligosaccharide flippase family protein [Muribaculaceae bacterium]
MAKTLTARVLKATSLLGSTQGVNMLCSIARTKALAMFIGPVGVGLFGAVSQAADMIGNFTQLNVRTSAVPALSAASAGRFDEMLISVRRCGRLLGIVGMVLMFLLAPLLSEAVYYSGEYTGAFRITAVSLLFVALQGSELVVLQATSRYKPIAASGLFTALTGMPLAIALYFWLGIDGVAPGIVAYSVLAFAGSWWFTRRYRPVGPKPSWRRSLSLGYGFVKVGLLLTLTSLATYGVNFVFMAFMRGNDEALGLYQAGYKVVWSYTGVFFMAFSMEFYPRLSKTVHNSRHVSLLISHQAALSSAVLAVGAAAVVALTPWLMPLLYRGDFSGADAYVRWGMVGMAFRPLSMAMSYSFLAAGRSRVYCATEVISALCGLALNVAGYRMAGFSGLGIATALWMFIELFIMLLAARFSRAPLPR